MVRKRYKNFINTIHEKVGYDNSTFIEKFFLPTYRSSTAESEINPGSETW